MKKSNQFILVILICFSFAACGQNSGNTDDVAIDLGESEKFSKEEIESATNCIIKKFKDFSGCELTELWYDEEYFENGDEDNNSIVLFSNFDVDSTGANNGFNPNSTYVGWKWYLTRDNQSDSWSVDDWGY